VRLICSKLVFTVLGIMFVRDMAQVESQNRIPENRAGWRLQTWSMFAVLGLITVSKNPSRSFSELTCHRFASSFGSLNLRKVSSLVTRCFSMKRLFTH
jgi:hypothetical protein